MGIARWDLKEQLTAEQVVGVAKSGNPLRVTATLSPEPNDTAEFNLIILQLSPSGKSGDTSVQVRIQETGISATLIVPGDVAQASTLTMVLHEETVK